VTEPDQLSRIIRQQIVENHGFIGFDRFMSAALYEPGLGYYESAEVFGGSGDFVTGADLGPWLAIGFADLIEWGWQELGRPGEWTLLEQGSGSGRLLASVLEQLKQRGAVPATVIAVERSANMRERQRACFEAAGHQVRQCASLDEVDRLEPCVMFSNELPDAFPVRCFSWKNAEFYERGVTLDNRGEFVWQDAGEPLQSPPSIDHELTTAWQDGYISEWNPGLDAWQASIGRVLGKGFAFTVDYGYAQSEYYRPGRITGTLLAHLAHQTSEDVLSHPGSRDLTAHVDFTALARAGQRSGLRPVSWLSQGAWLAQSPGVQQALQQLATEGGAEAMATLAHAKRLLLPFGMGETFKLLVQSAGSQTERPSYLANFDKLSALHLQLDI